MFEIIKNHLAIFVSIIIPFFGLIIVFFKYFIFGPVDKEKKNRQWLINFLELEKFTSEYHKFLNKILNLFDRAIGKRFILKKTERNWNNLLKNFQRHFMIAFFYPLFLFLFFWICGKSGSIGKLSLMPIQTKIWIRILFFLPLLIFAYLQWKLVKDPEKTSEQIAKLCKKIPFCNISNERKIITLFSLVTSAIILSFYFFVLKNPLFLSFLIALVCAFVIKWIGTKTNITSAETGLIAKVSMLALAIIFTSVFTAISIGTNNTTTNSMIANIAVILLSAVMSASLSMIAITSTSAGTIAITGAIAIALAFIAAIAMVIKKPWVVAFVILFAIVGAIFFGYTAIAISLGLFFLLLPFINAILDVASTWVSRVLFEKIQKDMDNKKISLKKIAYFTFLDMIFAIIFLFVLTFIFFFTLQVIDSFLQINELSFQSKDIINETFISQKSLWIIIMLTSTLLPTVFHFFAMLIAFLLPLKKIRLLNLLREYKSETIVFDKLQLLYRLILFPLFRIFSPVIIIMLVFYCSPLIISFLKNTAELATKLAIIIFS